MDEVEEGEDRGRGGGMRIGREEREGVEKKCCDACSQGM